MNSCYINKYGKKKYSNTKYGKNTITQPYSNMKCGNCGILGHIYSNCRLPKMSYGIIFFFRDKGVNKILLVQRRHTLTYIDFIRGKYTLDDRLYLEMLFSRMTSKEHMKILSEDFKTLWKDLWLLDKDFIEKRFIKEYNHSKQLFSKLKEGFVYTYPQINTEQLIFSIKTNKENININYFIEKHTNKQLINEYNTPEWGLPKGRRNINETDIEASIREFEEETNIDRCNIELLSNVYPISNEYYGSNNIKYKQTYYYARFKQDARQNSEIPLHIDVNNKYQVTEIGDIKWLTYEESLSLITPYEKYKIELIHSIFKFINNYSNYCGEY